MMLKESFILCNQIILLSTAINYCIMNSKTLSWYLPVIKED